MILLNPQSCAIDGASPFTIHPDDLGIHNN